MPRIVKVRLAYGKVAVCKRTAFSKVGDMCMDNGVEVWYWRTWDSLIRIFSPSGVGVCNRKRGIVYWYNQTKCSEREGGWCSCEGREGYSVVGVCKAIWRWWPLVNDRSSYVAGKGWDVKFWMDTWCDGHLWVPLSLPYLLLLSQKVCRWQSVRLEEGGVWNPLLTRHFNDW